MAPADGHQRALHQQEQRLNGVEAIKGNAADAQIDDQSGDDQDATATPRTATPDA